MKTSEAKGKAHKILTNAGYIFKGESIIAPDTKSPIEAISIQNQLSDITFFENGKEYTFQLRYIGDKLKLVNEEL